VKKLNLRLQVPAEAEVEAETHYKTKIQPKKEYTKVINFYELPEIKKNMTTVNNPGFHLTEIKLPCRMVVVALSGGGKTNFVMNFIKYTSVGQGTFSHKIDEELYTHLAE
jgi:hypothetical protein